MHNRIIFLNIFVPSSDHLPGRKVCFVINKQFSYRNVLTISYLISDIKIE